MSPSVLWVFNGPEIADDIPGVVAGNAGVSALLDYPECCVRFDSERKIALTEAYVQGIENTFHPTTDAELIELWKADVKVAITVDPDEGICQTDASLRRFPYVSFIACPRCRTDLTSPAVLRNRRMRDLAFSLAPSFGRQVWQTRDLLVGKGRPASWGRNDPCPCTSGLKFKKCCA
jgi:hypothetical protein